jgi:hypothetical protein
MPRGHGFIFVLLAVAAMSMVACSSAEQEFRLPPANLLAAPATTDPTFAAAPSILSGFDLASSPDDWQIGDQVLIGIRVTKPGKETVRFLHIELLDRFNPLPVISFKASPSGRPVYKFESGVYFTRMTLYDKDGKQLDNDTGRFPEKLMGHGLYDGAEPSIGRERGADGSMNLAGLDDEQAERELLGWLSLFSFSSSMNRKGMFNEMMKDVVARPSLLSMLLNPSVSLGMGEAEELERRAWTPATGISLDAVSLPLTCSISDKLGAVARVHAARPVAPLGLSGGVVSIVGNNAQKTDVTFEVRLLAAKRGDGKRAFRPAVEDPEP